jgi:hypothetical protein
MKATFASEHILIPCSSCAEPPERLESKIAPMAYGIIWLKPDGTLRYLNGYGGDKTPSVMLARGITIGIEAILLDDPELLDDLGARIVCVMDSLNFWKNPDKLLFEQLKAKRVTGDGHEEYLRLAELQELGKVAPRRPTTSEGKLVNRAKELAQEVAQEALRDFAANRERYRTPGVYVAREELPPLAVS